MHNIILKSSAFLLTCGFGILIAFLINGTTSRWSYLFAAEPYETRSCQVKLVDRNGQTFWMSCLQWEKHQQFEIENSY